MHLNNPFDLRGRGLRGLRLQTTRHSRCWEINSRHLTEEAIQFLQSLADLCAPTGLLFEAFRIPRAFSHCGDIVGVKLIDTPWTDLHLTQIGHVCAEQLHREHLDAGVPESLVHVMHLAAQANTRFLVFDTDADALGALPLYS